MDDDHGRRSNPMVGEEERERKEKRREREREREREKEGEAIYGRRQKREVVMYGGTAITVSLPCVPWNQPSVTYRLPLVIRSC